MIDPEHDLPIKQQAEVLDISRSTVYYEPRPVSAEDLWLMRHIDELHLNYPFAGRKFYNSVRPHSSLGALTISILQPLARIHGSLNRKTELPLMKQQKLPKQSEHLDWF